jgi:TRAP-type C4-dicarboxylate transport system substrate-binding protein
VEAALDQRGLVALQWSRIGAVHMFCARALRTPAEMKGARMWAWEGDPKSVEAFRAAGFSPVVLSSADIYASLQTGMIECVPNVPLYALTARLFEKANHMLGVPWSYVIGATVVRKDTWERIPAGLRSKLLAIAVELGAQVDVEVQKLNTDAVTAMQKQGLEVIPGDVATWRPSVARAQAVVRGGSVPVAFYDQTRAARDACAREAGSARKKP